MAPAPALHLPAPVRRRIRWALRHGLVRVAVARGRRMGDLTSRMMSEDALIEDPFPALEVMRGRGRLVPNGPVVLLAHDHDLATAILRSPDFGVVGGASVPAPGPLRLLERLAGPGPVGPIEPPSMLSVDPPDHTRFRRLVTRAFSAKAIARLRTRTEQIAVELLDAMAARGPRVDLVEDFADLLPATVITEILGAPRAMRRQFLIWGAGGARSIDAGLTYREFAHSEADLQSLHDWMSAHFDEVRRHPGDNVLSELVHARDEGGALTDDELASVAILLLAAGFETTVNLLSNAIGLFARHPEQLDIVLAEPALWPNAVDEVLRFESPVQRTARTARRDTVVAGESVPAGKIVAIALAAANRDPAVFTDPQTFDVRRPNAGEHVAFSSGIHYCLGAGLARMEAEVGLRALYERFPDLALTAPPHRRPTRVLRGYDAMPARLSAPATAPTGARPPA